MNLNSDNTCLKTGLYIVVLFVMGYLFKIIIDGLVYVTVNAVGIYGSLSIAVNKLVSVFSVLIGGFAAAYILDPAVDLIIKCFKIKRRKTAVNLLYCILIIIMLLMIAFMYLRIKYSGKNLSLQTPEYCRRVNDVYHMIENSVKDIHIDIISGYFDTVVSGAADFANKMSQNAVSLFSSVGSITVTGFLSIVVSYYFLVEKYSIISKLSKYGKVFIPQKIYSAIVTLIYDIDNVFSGYIRGQAADAVIMAVLIGVGLGLLRVKFAAAIGLISGFSNIIPYFGAIVGFVLAVVTALLSGEPVKALYAAIMLIVLQQLDSVYIAPKIVGNNVRLSPAAVILVLAVAGKLFGFKGLIFAVPVSAVIKTVIRRLYKKRLHAENFFID